MNEINKEERMQGLSGQQVSESKAKYGTNELAKKETQYNNGILICSLPGILFIIFQNH